jgi:hypothetical protein
VRVLVLGWPVLDHCYDFVTLESNKRFIGAVLEEPQFVAKTLPNIAIDLSEATI